MNFVSGEFLWFFVATYIVYWAIPSNRWRGVFLVIVSYVFYASWDWRYCGLMILVTTNSYLAGLFIKRLGSRMVLAISIATSLSVLGTFKYFTFLARSLTSLLAVSGYHPHFPIPGWVLPVGISFYTFHAISYVVDVYRGKVEREINPARVALYIAFFPQLIAGPITRASFFLPQLRSKRPFLPTQQVQGLGLFVRGLLYKAVIADTLAGICDPVYENVRKFDGHALVNAAFAFYGQIYFDFAGYSLMAIGAARILGYRIPKNFNYPYASVSLTEFWHRWHMSLSFWLRDYLYIPLGGNRGSRFAYYRNIMVTMLLGGLWHGAAWTFVVWGFLHGVGLWIHKIWLDARRTLGLRKPGQVSYLVALLLTQAWVLVTWVFFRARSFGDSWQVIRALTSWHSYLGFTVTDAALWVILLVVIDHTTAIAMPPLTRLPREIYRPVVWFGLGVVMALILMLLVQTQKPFIYFQF